MIELFNPANGLGTLQFLARESNRLVLLASSGALSGLQYAERLFPHEDYGKIDVRRITVGVLRQLKELNETGGSPIVFLVADEAGEGKRLKSLRENYPNLTFAGLGETLFPALVARNPGAIFDGVPRKAPCRQITLIFAPPRSGSSFVADVVTHVTGSKAREHLRNEVIEVLASPYKFNRAAALRNFLRLITTPEGQASTKIISHFLQDYVTRVGDLKLVKRVFEGVGVRAIVIERDDKVAQTISGYLASRRGIWHLESGRDAERLEAAREVGYDFHKLLPRYLGYRHQSYVLDFTREVFPDHLALEYGRDIEAGDAVALGARIAEFLGLPWDPSDQLTGRAKLANAENARLCARFRADYEELLGMRP